MSPDTVESAFIGLTLAVMSVLASAIMSHVGSAWNWLRYGFSAGEQAGRKGASVFIFSGLLMYGVFQMISRSSETPVPAIYQQTLGFVAWSLFGYGAIVWHASVLAASSNQSKRAARIYLWGMVATALACVVTVGALRPFHSVVVTQSAPDCEPQ